MPSGGTCILRAFGLLRWNLGCFTTLRPYYMHLVSSTTQKCSVFRDHECVCFMFTTVACVARGFGSSVCSPGVRTSVGLTVLLTSYRIFDMPRAWLTATR